MLANIFRKNFIPVVATGINTAWTAAQSLPTLGKGVISGGIAYAACKVLPCSHLLDTAVETGAIVLHKAASKTIESTITGVVQGVVDGAVKSVQIANELIPSMDKVFSYFGPAEGENYQDLTVRVWQQVQPVAETGWKAASDVAQDIIQHPGMIVPALSLVAITAVVYHRQAIAAKIIQMSQISWIPKDLSQTCGGETRKIQPIL
jgi:hypothetical protein